MLLVLLTAPFCRAQASFGESTLFNQGWKFELSDASDAADAGFDDSHWQPVDLPHDWSVKGVLSPDNASCTGFLPGGIAWYRKHFDGSQLTDEHVFIYFEGVYNRSSVYLNGHLLGERPNGYVSFMYELTPFLNRGGDNVLSVRVDHSRFADSRWYTGSGIYRDVYIIGSGDLHFAQWGLGWKLKSIDGKNATVTVDAAIEGLLGKSARLNLELVDAEGKVVAKTQTPLKASQNVDLKFKNPRRWNLDDPYLYTLKASIVDGGKTIDRSSCKVGLRTLDFNPDKGFALNGEWMKVKGVCLHHDAGVLGAAVPRDVWKRRLENLKALGTNAIRTSHNPQTPAFYDLCDELGLLVMDEAFDEWEYPKRKWVEGWNVGKPGFDGTYDFFEEWGETDVRDMVRRDRNHPSIFLWSIGNEVDYPNDPYSHPVLAGGNQDFSQPAYGGYRPDAPDAMRIGDIAKRLSAAVRDVDTSRPVTGAWAGVVMSNQTSYADYIDVVGYNYTESRYQIDHERYPERVIYGSENSSTYDAWTAARDNEHIFGQFIWTGTDYLGESNEWPSRGFYTGLLDFGSFRKPRGQFRASLWSDNPVCYIGTYPSRGSYDSTDAWDVWNYETGDMIHVVCYTNAEEAELFLDGKPAGERKPYDQTDGIISWDIPFKPGTLKAVAYADGKEVSEYSIASSRAPYQLIVSTDKSSIGTGSDEVAHVVVEILDQDGIPVKLGDNEIRCEIAGPGRLLGLEGSNNSDMTDYSDAVHRAYRGRLLAYIGAMDASGDIRVRFTSPYLKSCEITLKSE